MPEGADEPAAPNPEPGDCEDPEAVRDEATSGGPMADMVLEAAAAAMPANLLSALARHAARGARAAPGRSGAAHAAGRRGRSVGAWRGDPRTGRLAIVETLRAAAPWQRVRGRDAGRVEVRREDIRVTRFRERTETAAIFVVDASGSSALHRMAEAKGAVEMFLAECYARRDQVALLAFRGTGAQLLLPPTRSLQRARKSLAALPGGGGTPLAAGIDAAAALALDVRRKGRRPVAVFLTDGRANVARDGSPGRAGAEADADAAARLLRGAGVPALLVDTAPRPQRHARALADAMGATYLALPQGGAGRLSRAIAEIGAS